MRVRVDTHQGVLEREIELPGGEITLAGLARAVLPLADGLEALARRRAAEAGRPASCAKGCGACCRQLVTVSPAEAWYVTDLMDGLDAPVREETEARIEDVERSLARAGLLDALARLDDPALDEAAHYRVAEDYFRLGLACPFQTVTGACGIYARRPALCREYLVGSPAKRCADPFARPPEPLALAGEVSQALLGLSAQLLRHELQPIPLALAPRWAHSRQEAGRRAWDSGRILEKFLLYLEVSIGLSKSGGVARR